MAKGEKNSAANSPVKTMGLGIVGGWFGKTGCWLNFRQENQSLMSRLHHRVGVATLLQILRP
jgi:hypothetical protein